MPPLLSRRKLTMLLFLLALQSAEGPPTLDRVRALSPQAQGDLLLPQPHGVIASTHLPPTLYGSADPGGVRYELIEAPTPLAGGCVRRRWTTRFLMAGTPGGPRFVQVLGASSEISLPVSGVCPDRGYAQIDGFDDPAQAIGALQLFRRMQGGRLRVKLNCGSPKTLCSNRTALMNRLGAQTLFGVSRYGGKVHVAFRASEEASFDPVTVLSFDIDRPARVEVTTPPLPLPG